MSSPSDECHLQGEQTMVVSRSLLKNVNAIVAAVDRGSTLTKILYSEDSDDAESIVLHFALFRNKHFASAVQFLKEKLQARQLEGKKLHVTGVGADLHANVIKAELGVDTEFIDEAYCQFAGFHFLLRNFPVDTICHAPPQLDEALIAGIQRGEMFEKLVETQAELMRSQGGGDKFPCLFALYGSSAGALLVKEDGSIVVKHRHLLAGKSFLGLCQLLIGTSNYAEIMELAAAGKRGNIDTQVRDILADDPKSPYGRMPASLPFFPFGKAVDFDKSLEDISRQDVAQSLVSALTINFVNSVGFIASHDQVKNIFFGGNFFQHEFPRIEAMTAMKLFGIAESMNIRFLKTGHTAALGAMLSSTQDVSSFFAAMKLNV